LATRNDTETFLGSTLSPRILAGILLIVLVLAELNHQLIANYIQLNQKPS
jgi:hypothetical protein